MAEDITWLSYKAWEKNVLAHTWKLHPYWLVVMVLESARSLPEEKQIFPSCEPCKLQQQPVGRDMPTGTTGA